MKSVVASSAVLVALLTLQSTHAINMCNALVPHSWTQAASTNPKLQGALNELSKYAVATWYTDRWDDAVNDLLQNCSGTQVPSIVIYGLPHKDCTDGYSRDGKNEDSAKYKTWVQSLVSRVGSKEVVYVLEPDAIGLLSNSPCAKQSKYLENLKLALGLISSGNPNAKVYVDVATWSERDEATKVLNDLKTAGRLHGITINTSNYKSNVQLTAACEYYSGATGGLHCVFDTSRNYRGSVEDEWCNSRSAGIGAPPGSDTGHPLVDFNLWLKVPGESDGTCKDRTSDAQEGPTAGEFFLQGFTSLWNNGYFVDKQGLPKIGDVRSVPTPPTSALGTEAPKATTAAAPITASTSLPTTESTPAPPTTTSRSYNVDDIVAIDAASTVQGGGISSQPPSPIITTTTQSNEISVQAQPGEETSFTPSMVLLIAAVAVAGVVATVLAVIVIRKRNIREKFNDFIERDSSGIVVLGHSTPMHGLDTQRALAMI
ncbi:hypothetical protein B5M09_012669 [Aphanomyces astaci]|uniref:Glycoside hydrolase n=1 Tax=Aphanomyces astaci TaxID=112090 RepID=A0A425DLZ0_APHAT|nr:hypothetical protein B5M09_012669 [Aphanomyces astaci]